MSKKNRPKSRKNNIYPLPKRTVLYSHKKDLKPVPEVGKRYHCFDDGKITLSRHFIIKVDEVLGYMQFRKKYPKLFEMYVENVKRCYWLYSTHSDKFAITHEGENGEPGAYVRTKQGGWFGAGNWWNSALLDVDSTTWDNMIANARDWFGCSEEEIQRLIEENSLNQEEKG